MQFLQLRARFQAELRHELPAPLAERTQCFDALPRAVLGLHQLCQEALPERVLPYQSAEFTQQRLVLANFQAQRHVLLDGEQALLFQAHRLRLGCPRGDAVQRRAAPQAQCIP